jgi:hypothetical protein
MRSYPHMCRDEHVEIGHSDSSDDERCPLCRVISALQSVLEENDEFRATLPADWEGDTLHDACEEAKKVLNGVVGLTQETKR